MFPDGTVEEGILAGYASCPRARVNGTRPCLYQSLFARNHLRFLLDTQKLSFCSTGFKAGETGASAAEVGKLPLWALFLAGTSRNPSFASYLLSLQVLSLKLRDTRVYEPQIRARLGTLNIQRRQAGSAAEVGKLPLWTLFLAGTPRNPFSSSSLFSLQVLEGP